MQKSDRLQWYKNKTVLVTGGTSGIGLEMVSQLAGLGTKVVFCGRDPQAIESVSRATGADGLCVDLSRHEELPRFLTALRAKYRIDILVNNAGLGDITDFCQADTQTLLSMQSVNMDAVVVLCRELLPEISRQPGGGILNVGSVASFFPTPGSAVYGATKHFIAGFTDALHGELAGKGVHVTGIYPGKTSSRFLVRATRGKNADWDKAMAADVVARAALSGLACNRIRVIPGLSNKVIVLIAKFLPTQILLRVTGVRTKSPSGQGGAS